jgi:hypothetical protein
MLVRWLSIVGAGQLMAVGAPVGAEPDQSLPSALTLALQPGATAPDGASGTAEFDNRPQSGSTASLTLQLQKLLPGLYHLWLEYGDGQPPLLLNAFAITDPASFPSPTTSAAENENSSTEQVSVLRTRVQMTLPLKPEPKPFRLIVTDITGNILLSSARSTE